MAGADTSMLADRLQGGVTGDRHGGSLLEAHIVRLRREAICAADGVLGKRTTASPIGAGGRVGTFALQIAKADGAKVTGICSTAKTERVRSIGATT